MHHPLEMEHFYPVVMAGGSGTRFWPLSRELKPKQFLSIGSTRPLLVETMARFDALAPWSARYIVAGAHHREPISALCAELPNAQLIVEPCARNTAPCIGLVALHIAERDPQGVMMVSPADHCVTDIEAFESATRRATEGARSGKIVTLGVQPNRPETGYGYIQYAGGGQLNHSRHPVTRFVEKPPREIAESYLASGDYLWNSGVFFFSVTRILEEIQAQLPELYAGLQEIRSAIETPAYSEVLPRVFSQFRSVSIDVGVMEGAREVEVIPVAFGWSDVGHWDALSEIAPVDPEGNVALGAGSHIVLDARRNIIQSDTPIAVLGVEGLVIVQTDDVTLVCPRERAQDVKRIVAELKARGRADLI